MAIGILVPGHVAESREINCAGEMVKEEQMAARGWVECGPRPFQPKGFHRIHRPWRLTPD
jgi:hypothetical protein